MQNKWEMLLLWWYFTELHFLLIFNFLQGETLETITTATVCLFSAQPQLADQVPPLGHLHKIIQAMNHKNNAIPKSAIRVMHILSDNEVLDHLSAWGEKSIAGVTCIV